MDSPTLLKPGGDSEQRWLKQIAALLGLIFGTIVLAFCFFASSLCITIVLSAFLAILVDPLVVRVARIGLGRVLASGLVVACFMLLAGTLTYVLYNRASAFADEFPSYAHRIRQALAPLVSKFERFEKNAESITPLVQGSKRVNEVTVRGAPTNWPSFLVRGVGSISGVLIMGGVLPFLVFFMLVTKDQMNVRLVNMFESRIDVPKFVSDLGNMIRGFVLGNLIIGSIMAAGTSVVFLVLGMKGAVTLGIVSAFLNLIPFLGVLLATAVPLAAALLQFNTLGPFVTIADHDPSFSFDRRQFLDSQVDRLPSSGRTRRGDHWHAVLGLAVGNHGITLGRSAHGLRQADCRFAPFAHSSLKPPYRRSSSHSTMGTLR